MIGSSSTCDDHGENNKTEKDENFDAREPKLEFSEEGNAEVIDGDDCYQEYCDIQRWTRPWPIIVDLVEPKLDYECRRNEVIRSRNNVFQPVIPTCKLPVNL
jgi:hypothetical protein